MMPRCCVWIPALAGLFVLVLVVCLAPVALAGGDPPPATAPDGLSDQRLAALERLCQAVSGARWGTPVIETFSTSRPSRAWTARDNMVRIDYRDNKLIMVSDKSTGSIARAVPKELTGCVGFRIDAWVQLQPPGNVGVGGFYSSGLMFHGPDGTLQSTFLFASGANGAKLRFNDETENAVIEAPAVAAGKLMHVVFELQGDRVRAWTVGSQPLEARARRLTIWTKAPGMIALRTYGSLSLVQVAYRGLSTTRADVRELWRDTGFDSQPALTQYLLTYVTPRLDARRFADRSAASDLLERLSPLSWPALATATTRLRTEEGRLRAAELQACTPQVHVPTSLPDNWTKDPITADLAPPK